MTARVSMLLKSRASLTCFRACFFPGRDKDLSAPRYYPGGQIKKMMRAGKVARMGDMRVAYRVLAGRPVGKETAWKT